MNNPNLPQDDRFVESLLMAAYNDDRTADEQRISNLMSTISGEGDGGSAVSSDQQSRRSHHKMIRLAIAAGLLIAGGFFMTSLLRTDQANAAIQRAINATPPTREYLVQMVNRWPVVGLQQVNARLYFDDHNRFCLHHPGLLPGGEIWIGGDRRSRWIVPPIGPIVTGNENLIASALNARKLFSHDLDPEDLDSQGLGSPMLHLQTALQKLCRNYDLEMLSPQRIADPKHDNQTILCDHVVGRNPSATGNSPIQIDLWANRKSGVAERIEIRWREKDSTWLPLRWDIQLVGHPELPSDWFSHVGHSDADRQLLHVENN
ncbi:hypothetical protein [Rhodopirellula sp. MGV]|uniref:hypothetical protein n=1 Tax=Rhodopirellula sp. MGV TaxID=2023130 RepID=UPI000B9730B1|nr:hypothetical protein [Rhodopirellula sp. MGV]OYP36066.1 hypothetical protein CGZ80_09985 [Rhodopirellula sp. MGV]PNY36576.1 hypothetical protein C2E31_12025 [Rhodopirellula baltica]